MLDWFKKNWQLLKKSKPGKRFQVLYQRRQESRRSGLKKASFIIIGLLIMATGFLSYPVPGLPSDFVILFGLIVLSQGSLHGAKVLDWLELRLRGPFLWGLKYWKPLSRPAKVAVSLVWMSVLGFAGFGLYYLVLR